MFDGRATVANVEHAMVALPVAWIETERLSDFLEGFGYGKGRTTVTEFEAATLALQQQQLWAALAVPLVALIVGAGQVIVVSVGIRVMRRTSDQREKREDARHAEAMEALRQQAEALRVLIERTAPRR